MLATVRVESRGCLSLGEDSLNADQCENEDGKERHAEQSVVRCHAGGLSRVPRIGPPACGDADMARVVRRPSLRMPCAVPACCGGSSQAHSRDRAMCRAMFGRRGQSCHSALPRNTFHAPRKRQLYSKQMSGTV